VESTRPEPLPFHSGAPVAASRARPGAGGPATTLLSAASLAAALCGLPALAAPVADHAAAASLAIAPAATLAAPLEAAGPLDSRIRLELTNRLRGEFWSFFDTPSTGPTRNANYDFLGNRFQLGLRVARDPLELFAQLQHSLVWPAPENAPGAGGAYFLNTRRELQQEPILRQGWLRWRGALGVAGLSTALGRQLYRDGLESPAQDPTLQWIQRARIAERLIGPFDYTHIGRSFDGGQLAYDLPRLNLTGFGFVPTAGGFEISANREIASVQIAGLALTAKESPRLPGTHARLFWIFYNDHRNVVAADNRLLAARQADRGNLELHTLGAHLAHVRALGPGKADLLAWAAGQAGDWQSLTHRAWAYALEAGWQWPGLWAGPWLRGGVNSGSGDGDPGDGRHGTFFQILPTPRIYAQFPFYNMMNNQDVFVQALLRPHRMLHVRTDLRWLRVTSSRDLLYAGGGATSQRVFGYSGTPAGGRNELGYLVDLGITLTPVDFLTIYSYYGHVFGQGVINQAFRGRDADYGYVEATLSF
jgi:hypothetical protein